MKYSLPPSKRLVMTLTAKDNGACLHCSAVLKILEIHPRAQEKTNRKQKYQLEIKVVKIMQKNLGFLSIFVFVRYQNLPVERLLGQNSHLKRFHSARLGQMCRARKRVFSLFKSTLRSQWHQGWQFKFFFSELLMVLEWGKVISKPSTCLLS